MVNSNVLRVHRDGLSEGRGSGPPCDTTSMMWLVGPTLAVQRHSSVATRERALRALSSVCVLAGWPGVLVFGLCKRVEFSGISE